VLGGARSFGAHRGRRGAGHIVAAARLQLVAVVVVVVVMLRNYSTVLRDKKCAWEMRNTKKTVVKWPRAADGKT